MTTALSQEQRIQLEAQLQARRAQLARQMAEHQTGQSRVEYAAELLTQDSHDASQHAPDREVELARSDRELQALGQIDLALARIHQPEYGLCGDCGEPIAAARLALEPWALRCVACESARELAHAGQPVAHHTL